MNGPEDAIYLDYAATTPMLPEAAEAAREASLRYPANPESQHAAGREARRALEEARDRIAELLGASTSGPKPDQVVFTSGGTESNNLAVLGLTDPAAGAGHVVTTAIEHPAVGEPIDRLAQHGGGVDRVAPGLDGCVAADAVTGRLRPETQLASVMLVNNETGSIQPVPEIAAACRAQGVLMHTDASQAVGKIPVRFSDLGLDALSCAAHKFHGPKGVGLLLLRHGLSPRPTLLGGHQQAGVRPGTENVALAVGMRVALEAWHSEQDRITARITRLRERFEAAIAAEDEGVCFLGDPARRCPHIASVAFPGLDRQALAMALDAAGVACSTGSACASGSSEPSPVLAAMGLPEELLRGAVRFSFGRYTTESDIDRAAVQIVSISRRLRGLPEAQKFASAPP
ncbi:MAG: cysteine desulfurase family protein [Planctomycetota bacterium]